MIEDLKADSARWDSERRAQTSRNTPGGIHTSRDATGVPARPSSNSPAVQYRYSETHQSRQHHGPTEPPYQQDPYHPRESYDGPRYPGTGAPGYTGATPGFQQPPQQGYGSSNTGGYGGSYQQPQHPSQTDPRYAPPAQAGSMVRPGGYQPEQDAPYIGTGANLPQSGYAAVNDPYASRMGPAVTVPQQPVYATGPPAQSGYPASAPPQYQYQSQPPPQLAGGHSYPAMQPQDPFYGRGASKQRSGEPSSPKRQRV